MPRVAIPHVALVCLLTIAAAAVSFGQSPQPQSHPNVILISLDQCRADQLHSYGNPRSTSPNLDRIASRGVRFTRFYSAAPWTTPSYGAIMTSQYPSRHGATLMTPPGVAGIRSGSKVLAELFRNNGYYTGAFVNNSVAGAFLTRPGFADYDEGQKRKGASVIPGQQDFRAPATNQRVFTWLDEHSAKPFFLFLLYFEPHSPYDPPPQDDLFKGGKYAAETNTGYDLTKGRLFRLANLRDTNAIDRLTQLYDGKIHFIDRYIGQLFEQLHQRGLDRNTIVWITSDHGELLYSHAADYMTFDHRSLYDQVMHVPRIVVGPGVPHGRMVDALTTHVDIGPSLLELAGLPPKSDAQGKSLVPLMSGATDRVHDVVFGEQDVHERLRSVRDVRFKLIWNVDNGEKKLFDDANDPGEQHDVTAQHEDEAEKLARILLAWRNKNEPPDSVLRQRWQEIAQKQTAPLVVDEVTIGARFQLMGSGWKAAEDPSCYDGGLYWTDAAASSTDSPQAAVWRSDDPLIGRYRISIWYGKPPGITPTKAACLTITTRSGQKLLTLDQSRNAGRWNELGIFADPVTVRLEGASAGALLADAVRFERLGDD